MTRVTLKVEVPVCGFRPRWSGQYQDTHPVPPPSTVFGMLLSLAGVEKPDAPDFAGARLALALEGEPSPGRVFRKFRRVPQSDRSADPLTSRRPDWQELLLNLVLWVWVEDGDAPRSLGAEVARALSPATRTGVVRQGGLSLGESSHLVNEVSLQAPRGRRGRFLRRDPLGPLCLPVWTCHPDGPPGRARTGRFTLTEEEPLRRPRVGDARWITIHGPEA
ncbi:MAG: CRISPR-associated protein Cas5 [Proteobacteria bacterium]|nr:CRISPR-associated protein Cas5 [Pseudomonadota bacterium]